MRWKRQIGWTRRRRWSFYFYYYRTLISVYFQTFDIFFTISSLVLRWYVTKSSFNLTTCRCIRGTRLWRVRWWLKYKYNYSIINKKKLIFFPGWSTEEVFGWKQSEEFDIDQVEAVFKVFKIPIPRIAMLISLRY